MDQVKFFKGYLAKSLLGHENWLKLRYFVSADDHVSRVISTSSECPEWVHVNFGIFQRTICVLKETLKLK